MIKDKSNAVLFCKYTNPQETVYLLMVICFLMVISLFFQYRGSSSHIG